MLVDFFISPDFFNDVGLSALPPIGPPPLPVHTPELVYSPGVFVPTGGALGASTYVTPAIRGSESTRGGSAACVGCNVGVLVGTLVGCVVGVLVSVGEVAAWSATSRALLDRAAFCEATAAVDVANHARAASALDCVVGVRVLGG